MKKLAILASGRGSNAQKILSFFEDKEDREVVLIVTNNPKARVLDLAKENDIPSLVLNKFEFYNEKKLAEQLSKMKVDLIVLAGFLWLVPEYLIQAFPQKIINIHPALLPAYGGKGMYGMHVHRAVFDNKEKESGITIHYVNEAYDEGAIIRQEKCAIDEEDTPEMIAQKVLKLEHYYLPIVVDELLKD